MKRRRHPRQHRHPVPAETLRLAVVCPECGAPPATRISPAEREMARGQAPNEFKMTIQCVNPQCRVTYIVPASAYQHAA